MTDYISPPPELVEQWTSWACENDDQSWNCMATWAAQWGYQQAQPEPQGPTDEELRELRRFHQWPIGEFLLFTISRAVLARYGRRAGEWQ